MPNQNVDLTPELEKFVESQVDAGFFNDASEVHRAALSAMAKQEEERQIRMELLQRELQKGIDDLESGNFVEIRTPEEHANYFRSLRNQSPRVAEED